MKIVFLDHSTYFALNIESQKRKKFVIERYRNIEVFDGYLYVVNDGFHNYPSFHVPLVICFFVRVRGFRTKTVHRYRLADTEDAEQQHSALVAGFAAAARSVDGRQAPRHAAPSSADILPEIGQITPISV